MAFFSLLEKKSWNFLCFDLKRALYITKVMINRTSCHPISSVIILVIKQIRLPLCGHLTTLITCMITDWIGLYSVLFPLLICCKPPWHYQQTVNNAWGSGLDNWTKLDGGFVKHCLKNLFYNWALEIVDEKVINKLLVGCSSFLRWRWKL